MENEVFPESVRRLVDLLGKPEEGELNYTGEERAMSRLEALRELKRLEKMGVFRPPEECGGVNTHIHTSESFSIFKSPAEAAWMGYRAGLEIFGINDHYTIAGHEEFGEACKILGLKATFNIEAIAMSEEAKERGERYNDPKNPGRIYLCGKGVVRDLKPGSPSERLLTVMRSNLRKRYEEMTEKARLILREIDPSLSLAFEDVLRLTPRGNVTERHVAQAIAEFIERKFSRDKARRGFIGKLLGDFKEEDVSSEGRLQDLVRNGLLKAGGRAYVEEPTEAFPGVGRLVRLLRDYRAIPTYPVLGNPLTDKENDLDSLFGELEDFGIFAVEVIPLRNTRGRLQEILNAAEEHGFPVFNGTEHNTKSPRPIIDKHSRDPCFLPVFRRGAYVILGHQFLSRHAGRGYVDEEGRLTIDDRETGVSFFSFAGRITWPEKVLGWLTSISEEEVYKMVLGLHEVLDGDDSCRWIVKPDFKMPVDLLDGIIVRDGHAAFVDEDMEERFREIARSFFGKIATLASSA